MTHTPVPTPDGGEIAVRFFEPDADPRATVLIVPAMGISQTYYGPLAGWLAGRGYLAATFDYRGVGLSRNGRLRDVRLDILDWARGDCPAALEALRSRSPRSPLYWIGHSLGGQILPFVPNRNHVAKAVNVATGSGYWRQNTPALRRTVWWLWYVAVPVSVRLFGYFPGRRLRKVGDLPRGVIEQWRRWCLDPEYSVGAEGAAARELYASLTIPITSLSFTDDEFMSARNIDSIHGFFSGAELTMKRIAPADAGVDRIGHFGFFKPAQQEPLWERHLLPELAAGTE